MNKKLLFTLFSVILFQVCAFSQSIQNIDPSSVVPGDAVTVSVTGIGTHFKQGVTTFNFGNNPNVSVINVKVYSPSSASAFVTFPANMPTGSIQVTLKTGSESAVYTGFTVAAAQGVIANLEVLPTQTIYVTDFDPGNAASAPIIFDVSVSNYTSSALTGDVATLTIKGQVFGTILTATKTLTPSIQPNATLTFTNRDFDKYNVGTNDQAFVDKATQTGLVPPDVYTYTISITDKNGKQVCPQVSGVNAITNPGSTLALISPGAPLTSSPEQISEYNPLFQWFDQETSYDLYLYQVRPGQTSGSDITSNTPIFYTKGLTSTSFNYPLSALPLVKGTTYAWQIIGHSTGSHGDQLQSSPVFWFSVGAPGNAAVGSITKILVQPGDIEMDMKDTFQFTSTAYDNQENVVNLKPQWRVVPAEGGTISQNGVFVAGNTPMTVAVVAAYGDKEEYSTVQINLGGLPWDFEAFFKQIFGLPSGSK